MRAVIQRVSEAQVSVNDKIKGQIEHGILILLGIGENDNSKLIDWMANKIINLRIFNDEEGKMNNSVLDVNGGILLISNFTLYGDAMKGFRPSFVKAAKPHISEPLYEEMIEKLNESGLKIQTGIFGAMMDVKLINSGPVTIQIEKEA